MNTDCYFEIGHSHTICQDYALTGKLNEHLSYAIISDGCSASPLVDVGARLLAHSAKEHLITRYESCDAFPDGMDPYLFGFAIIVAAAKSAQMLSLPLESLDCTLIVSLGQEKHVRTFLYGDGGLITKAEGERSYYQEVEFESGAPFYLSYLLNPKREDAYRSKFGLKATTKLYRIDDKELTEEVGGQTIEDVDSPTFFRSTRFERLCVDVEWASIMSDGVKTYQICDDHGIAQPLPLQNALTQISAHKMYKGKFVERRMKRMRKDCEKNGITHYDDISVASIYVGD